MCLTLLVLDPVCMCPTLVVVDPVCMCPTLMVLDPVCMCPILLALDPVCMYPTLVVVDPNHTFAPHFLNVTVSISPMSKWSVPSCNSTTSFRRFFELFSCILPNLPISSRTLHTTVIIIGKMYKLTNCFERSQWEPNISSFNEGISHSYGTRSFTAAFTWAPHLSLSWIR
jgi:hypothetical protein